MLRALAVITVIVAIGGAAVIAFMILSSKP